MCRWSTSNGWGGPVGDKDVPVTSPPAIWTQEWEFLMVHSHSGPRKSDGAQIPGGKVRPSAWLCFLIAVVGEKVMPVCRRGRRNVVCVRRKWNLKLPNRWLVFSAEKRTQICELTHQRTTRQTDVTSSLGRPRLYMAAVQGASGHIDSLHTDCIYKCLLPAVLAEGGNKHINHSHAHLHARGLKSLHLVCELASHNVRFAL